MIKYPTSSEVTARMRKAEADVRALTTERDGLATTNSELRVRLAVVRELHRAQTGCCEQCEGLCADCSQASPCATIRALDGTS